MVQTSRNNSGSTVQQQEKESHIRTFFQWKIRAPNDKARETIGPHDVGQTCAAAERVYNATAGTQRRAETGAVVEGRMGQETTGENGQKREGAKTARKTEHGKSSLAETRVGGGTAAGGGTPPATTRSGISGTPWARRLHGAPAPSALCKTRA